MLRRLDDDADGFVSPKEFKLALRRMRYVDEKLWILRLIRKLFAAINSSGHGGGKEGLLHIATLGTYIRAGGKPADPEKRGDGKGKGGGKLSDDEDDALFSQEKVFDDQALFKKVRILRVRVRVLKMWSPMIQHLHFRPPT